MTMPSVVGSNYLLTIAASTHVSKPVTLPLPGGVVDGDLVLAIIAHSNTTGENFQAYVSPVTPGDWTFLAGQRDAVALHAGTLAISIYAAIYDSSLDMQFIGNNPTDKRLMPGTVVIRNHRGLENIIVGPLWDRATFGTATTSVAGSITTTQADTLVLGILSERTTATEGALTSVTGADFLAFWQDTTSASIETVMLTTEQMAIPGATGNTTATYPNSQASNGYGIHIGIAGAANTEVPVAGDQITFPAGVGNVTAADSNAVSVTSLQILIPANRAIDDLLLAFVYNAVDINGVGTASNAGWVRLTPTAAGDIRELHVWAYAIPNQAALDALGTSVTFTNSTMAGRMVGAIYRAVNADLTDYLDTMGSWPASASAPYTIPALTTERPDDQIVAVFYTNSSANVAVPTGPALPGFNLLGYYDSENGISVANSTISIFEKSADSTTQGAVTITFSGGTVTNGAGIQFGLRSKLGTTTPDNAVDAIYIGAGQVQQPGKLYYVNETGPHPVTDVFVIGDGYDNVLTMLGDNPFYVAHRGGSRSFPEMSLHAYTQSALRGYGALEVSLARTNDGVWFGLHDQYLDRTSLGTNTSTLNPTQMSWAQVQQYVIKGSSAAGNPTQPDRPYMRLEEIIERYYSTHVLFIDPKHSLAMRAELMNYIDSLPGTPQQRIVYKYFGVEGNAAGTSGLAYDAAQRGYQRWGYFYDLQVDNGDINTYQARWSILGMDYLDSENSWNVVNSFGKPVLGHICPDQAAVNTCLARGADGVMVSGTAVVTPV